MVFQVIPTDPVKTSQPQVWHKPRGDSISGAAVQEVVATGYNKRRGPMEAPKRIVKSTLYNPVRGDFPALDDLKSKLSQVSPSALILPALESASRQNIPCVPTHFGNFARGSVLAIQQKLHTDYNINVYDGFEYPTLPVMNRMINEASVFPLTYQKQLKLESLKLTESDARHYEELTRTQSQCPLWFALKKDRLGASKMRRVLTRTKNFEKLADDLRKKNIQTQAMLAGLADEPVAVAKYVDLNNHSINIYPAGIVINPVAYWIGASPDRKVYIPDRVPSVGILEVKCPRVSSVLGAKCLKHSPGQGLKLNRNDPYFTQIQTQLAVTGLEWCDFFVWCQNDYHLETINFDADEWQKIKHKADLFFFNYYL